MKKYIYIFAAFAAAMSLSSCLEEHGTEPGNDSNPVVTVYNYAPSSEYDGDTDQRVRFINNGKAAQAYYLVEPKADKDALIDSKGESAYIDKVISEGKAITFDKEGIFETTITEMGGDYSISAVAVDGSKKTLRSTDFSGIPWDASSSIEGTYTATRSAVISATGGATHEAVLQRHQTNPKIYRIKGAFGPGTKITLEMTDVKMTDADGEEYTIFRVAPQVLPFTYGSYGNVNVRDMGYWQGDDAYVFSYGYESGMYADGYCFFTVQFYVSAGSLGWGTDTFEPK
ncbi:MAG: hypothetical protein IJ578_02465 [Bacteroidales bacterium]|nr:hypothetical protein [Bacteroidales bacterium]